MIYGVRGYKTHAKICLIVRRTPHGLRRYVHLGTGNYNERTARVYTDFGLMTSSPAIAEDATAFFSALTGYSDPPRLKKLVMAPTGLRAAVPQADRARAAPRRGGPAGGDRRQDELARSTTRSSRRCMPRRRPACEIRLNVRGICALRPGVPGVSENIEVVSIVDRFLEHSRIYLLPQRRRRGGLPRERGLDDAQPRQAHRADVPGRGSRAQGARCCTRCARCSATT